MSLAACGGDDDGGAAASPDGGGTSTTGNPSTNPGSSGDSGTDPGSDPNSGPSCTSAGESLAPGVSAKTISVGGSNRTYQLYVPSTFDGKKTYPLIFAFHGDGGDGTGLRKSFKIEAETKEGAIIVYPDGLNKTWDCDTTAGLARDTAFIDAVVAELTKNACADAARVYATGFSRGAYFVNQMVCRSKSTWRAIATHSGGGPWGIEGTEYDAQGQLKCNAKQLAALQVQGLADTTVPPSEGQKARDFWRAADGCQSATEAYDPSPCQQYKGCAKPEVYCAIPGMQHTIWASAAPVTWNFFTSQK
ncbi:putative secreted protein [Labilithrix luteola]|uniref:Putative secreted protein n=1 Tax=Labilithrix luteola TaxID=1391654 RepID=A0A0K1Q0E7_9BACT|nr:putative secreted protein [Labilithrix luteola]